MLLQSHALTTKGITVETVQDPILSLNDLLVLGEETLTGVSQVTLTG
ncbi:hypothetical protein CCP3SC1_650013 [Gammaproteobacteria bacterium]